MASSMKQLEEQVSRLFDDIEDLADRLKAIEEEYVYPTGYATSQEVVTQEDLYEMRVATINALYNQRSQGAHNMAKALELKYFDGEDVQEIGDRIIKHADLHSAGKKEGEK